MSDLGLNLDPGSGPPHEPRRRVRSVVAVLASLAVLIGVGLGVRALLGLVPDLGRTSDYNGSGEDPPVDVQIEPGATLAEMGQTLKTADVVASVDAWLDAAAKEPDSSTIGPGIYSMLTRMSADSAVERMVDPDSRVSDKLLLREGLRMWESFAQISAVTGISEKDLDKASKQGAEIGLPDYANNFAEGFLFPATYEFDPDETATQILTRLVTRWNQAAAAVDLTSGAKDVGLSEYEVMIVASLVQAEGQPEDFAKVARVIYNRLNPDTWAGTNGFLQMDATVNYALKASEINLSNAQLQGTDSPYNTYLHPGLPPTPINSPGEAAMEAALNPEDGPWLYYVTVNPDTGETKFTDDYDEFLKFKDELSAWHDQNP